MSYQKRIYIESGQAGFGFSSSTKVTYSIVKSVDSIASPSSNLPHLKTSKTVSTLAQPFAPTAVDVTSLAKRSSLRHRKFHGVNLEYFGIRYPTYTLHPHSPTRPSIIFYCQSPAILTVHKQPDHDGNPETSYSRRISAHLTPPPSFQRLLPLASFPFNG